MFAADFIAGTTNLSLEEVGIYIRLLNYQWVNGPFENDPKTICRIAGCSKTQLKNSWKNLKNKFIFNSNGYLINSKLDGVRIEQENRNLKNKENAKRGGEATKKAFLEKAREADRPTERPSETEADRLAERGAETKAETGPNLYLVSSKKEDISFITDVINSSETVVSNTVEIIEKSIQVLTPQVEILKTKTAGARIVVGENRFDEFWNLYPKKADKKKAFTVWMKIKPEDRDKIISTLPAFNLAMAGRDASKIMHPTTFLNGERWNDELEVPKTLANSKPIAFSPSMAEKIAMKRNPQPLLAAGTVFEARKLTQD